MEPDGGNKLGQILQFGLTKLVLQYIVVLIILYFKTQLQKSVNNLSLAEETLKVIVNELNEAIFLRSENGNLGFGNKIGL